MSTPKTCYYDLLEVNRDALDIDLKKAYRRLAIIWHPDKNLDRIEEATIKFSEIQHAFQVLSDPNDRAWYDDHRDQILSGEDANFEYSDGIGVSELIAYFNPFYKGYDDDPKGFYSIHRQLFSEIAKSEEFKVDEHAISFGDSNTSLQNVKKFYDFWKDFSTTRSFSWKERYNPSNALDRQTRRFMEKENKRAKENGQKEYNSTVRRLVNFIMKNDPRYKAFLAEQKEEKEAKKDERIARLKLQKEKAKKDKDDLFEIQDWAQLTEQDLADLELIEREWEDNETLVKSNLDVYGSQDESEVLYCVACEIEFSKPQQLEQHKSTKKHLKMLEKLKSKMLEEDILFNEDFSKLPEDHNKSFEKNLNLLHDDVYENDIESAIYLTEELNLNSSKKKNKKKNKNNKILAYSSDMDNEFQDVAGEETIFNSNSASYNKMSFNVLNEVELSQNNEKNSLEELGFTSRRKSKKSSKIKKK